MTSTLAISNRRASDLGALLERNKGELAKAAASTVSIDRLLKLAVGCVAKTPKLAECTIESLVSSVKVCAELGLEPGGPLGLIYLVPYKGVCTPIVGYRGLITLARRSGNVGCIEAHVVREHDKFKCTFGLSGVLEHEPKWKGERGEPVLVYAVATMADGAKQFEVMSFDEVEAVRKRSRAANDGPWVTDWDEMAKKTVVRRLAKYLPLAVEEADAIAKTDTDMIAPSEGQWLDRIGDAEVRPLGAGQQMDEQPVPIAGEHVEEPANNEPGAALTGVIDRIAEAKSRTELQRLSGAISALSADDKQVAISAYNARLAEIKGVKIVDAEPAQ